MNVEASIECPSPKMSRPPNHSTDTMSSVPELAHGVRQRLTGGYPVGYVIAQFVAALFEAVHHLVFGNRCLDDAQSAQRLFNCDMVSLHFPCASSDLRFSFLPTLPMSQPMPGSTKMVNSVSCQLVTISVEK